MSFGQDRGATMNNVRAVGVLAAAFAAFASLPAPAADLLSPVPVMRQPASADRPWLHVWTGVAAAPDSLWGYAGLVMPLHGNLWVDDFLLRAQFDFGRYGYTANAFDVNVNHVGGDLMVGYQRGFGGTWLTGYVGANYQRDNNPDPAAAVRGAKWGLKVQGEAYVPFSPTLFGYGLGSYSTAFSTYQAMGRLGFRLNERFSIGPEVSALGNDGFDQLRVGASAGIGIGVGTHALGEFILSAGWAHTTSGNGRDGAYAGIHYRALLH